jgi:hypothetical protein
VASLPHDGRTEQGSFLLMVPIKAGHLADLEQVLRNIAVPPGGEDLELNPIIPFRKLETVHFARILIHHASPSAEAPIPEWNGEPQASGPPIPAKLLFATDYDGPLGHHVDELLRVAGHGLDQVFAHCEGWQGHARHDAAHAFFERYHVRSNTFYTGTMHRSVAQIRREMELRAHIEDYLDSYGGSPEFPADPVAARQRIREFVFSQTSLAWAKEQPGPFPKPLVPPSLGGNLKRTAIVALSVLAAAALALLGPRIGFWPAAGSIAGVIALFVIAGFAAMSYLSSLAKHDPVIIRDDVQEHTARLVRTEDRIVQNEMSSVIYIKRPLWFRRLVLQAVLAFINLSARYSSNEGTLAGIPSIHFARWVIVDEGRRLVFFSNFDGSWTQYLGDFIDKSGALVINPQFESAGDFSDGLALVSFGGKYGYIDRHGKIAIAPQFDDAGEFSDGLARAGMGARFGFIDKQGKFAINPQYDRVGAFEDGLAPVWIGNRQGYIDKNGKFVWNPSA